MKTANPLLPADFHTRTDAEKERYLDANADRVIKNETIRRPLSDDEKESLRFKLEKLSIQLADLNEEYDEVKKTWRETLKDAKESVADVLSSLKSGFEKTQGDKFEIRDYESDRVFVFDKHGTEIESRPLLHEERQSTIQSSMRKVENNN